jgi:hypothetical protein
MYNSELHSAGWSALTLYLIRREIDVIACETTQKLLLRERERFDLEETGREDRRKRSISC